MQFLKKTDENIIDFIPFGITLLYQQYQKTSHNL